MTVTAFDPEDVAHRLDVDGEIVGVEWDAGSHKVRVVTRPVRRRHTRVRGGD